MNSIEIKLKRVYERPSKDDGFRVLVDRLWPRGVSKADASLASWMKEIAPSDELRRWFDHDPDKWDEFRRRYEMELEANRNFVELLKGRIAAGPVTLVYAARNAEYNHAVALRDYLTRVIGADSRQATHK